MIAVTLALLAVPASYVFGSHVFSDVSSSAYYHDSVTAMFNSGVTSGCGGTKYCPTKVVTRGQMAKFLDSLGGLSLGPGGQARPVTDALSVQGTRVHRSLRDIVIISGSASSVCSTFSVGPVAADFGSYSITHRLYKTPAGINPEEINLQLRDADDPPPDEYEVCLASIDGSPLPVGTYRTYETEMVFHGQRTFAG